MKNRKSSLDSGRRDFVRTVTALPLIPLATSVIPNPEAAVAIVSTPGTAIAHTFNPHQWATLSVLSDWIIPEDERSVSASRAGVVKFLDDWLGHKGGDDLATITGGLVWLDKVASEDFGTVFIQGSEAQQRALIERIAWPERTAPEDLPGEVFFSLLRDLVVGAFFSTEEGVRDLPFLGNQVLSEWHGCPDVATLLEQG